MQPWDEPQETCRPTVLSAFNIYWDPWQYFRPLFPRETEVESGGGGGGGGFQAQDAANLGLLILSKKNGNRLFSIVADV